MSRLIIDGNKKLAGEVNIQGAKNSALPVLAATILCKGQCVLHNCPRLSDVEICIKILRYLGCKVKREEGTLLVNTDCMDKYDIPHQLMKEMRSSIVFLGAIISRMKQAKMTSPGGCELGPRPIDLHIDALSKMGVEIAEKRGKLSCKVPGKIHGKKISLSFPSVGATENIMLAAVCAEGTTIITNAAREPEICDLASFLNNCGARISGAGEGTIYIDGVESLDSCQHSIIPDRIVAATYMSAIAVTGGEAILKHIIPSHLNAVAPVFEQAGCDISYFENNLHIKAPKRLKSVGRILTMPFPGFPTDAQAPVMSMTTVADGTTMFVENIFESRYKHVPELSRMGAKIKVEGKVAMVEGVPSLWGAEVDAMDLRGSAALVVAGLNAEGQTVMNEVKYLERGYEDLEVNLTSMGANVKKI